MTQRPLDSNYATHATSGVPELRVYAYEANHPHVGVVHDRHPIAQQSPNRPNTSKRAATLRLAEHGHECNDGPKTR